MNRKIILRLHIGVDGQDGIATVKTV